MPELRQFRSEAQKRKLKEILPPEQFRAMEAATQRLKPLPERLHPKKDAPVKQGFRVPKLVNARPKASKLFR